MLPGLLTHRPNWLKALVVNVADSPASLIVFKPRSITRSATKGMNSNTTEIGLNENLSPSYECVLGLHIAKLSLYLEIMRQSLRHVAASCRIQSILHVAIIYHYLIPAT